MNKVERSIWGGHLTLNVSNDGLVYAADRAASRIHVTTKERKFLKEFIITAPMTRTDGSDRGTAGGVAFSPDKAQRYLYISDIRNNTIWFLNREDGKVVGRLSSMGESGGQFFGLHMIATDSRGYIYTGEVFAGQACSGSYPLTARGENCSISYPACNRPSTWCGRSLAPPHRQTPHRW